MESVVVDARETFAAYIRRFGSAKLCDWPARWRWPQSLCRASRSHPLRAQNETPGTPPLKGTPAPDDNNKPAESKPGGTRPTDPAPEPAHPAPEAEKKGAKQALPPAPAEKIAPPIKEK
jgi:hypothetical protein